MSLKVCFVGAAVSLTPKLADWTRMAGLTETDRVDYIDSQPAKKLTPFDFRRVQKACKGADLIVVLGAETGVAVRAIQDATQHFAIPFPHPAASHGAAFELECLIRLKEIVGCARTIKRGFNT